MSGNVQQCLINGTEQLSKNDLKKNKKGKKGKKKGKRRRRNFSSSSSNSTQDERKGGNGKKRKDEDFQLDAEAVKEADASSIGTS